MKTIIGLIVVLFGWSSAHATVEKNCKLEGGAGPFRNFQVTLPSEFSDIKKGAEVKISGYFNRSSGSVYTDRRINWTTTVTEDSRGVDFWVDYIDWASITFHLSEDDDGLTAYLEHRSDGPYLNSYYRCN